MKKLDKVDNLWYSYGGGWPKLAGLQYVARTINDFRVDNNI